MRLLRLLNHLVGLDGNWGDKILEIISVSDYTLGDKNNSFGFPISKSRPNITCMVALQLVSRYKTSKVYN